MLWNRSLNQMDPWREMDLLQREMNRLFNETGTHSGRTFPTVNIYSDNNEAFVTAELPGMKQTDIKLSLQKGQLTIEGEREAPKLKKDQQLHRRERRSGSFKRTIQLPYAIESDKISANLKQGILTVRLPRKEDEKPRTIEIQTK